MIWKLASFFRFLPVELVAIFAAAYLYLDWTEFLEAPDSPVTQRKATIESKKKENEGLSKKLTEAQEFWRTLEARKVELRELSRQLQEMRAGINGEVDVPAFMTLTVTEAKRVGLNVLSIKPESQIKHEYFVELPFSFQFKGVYVQLLVFLQRMANTQNIIRVDSFDLRPVSDSGSKYVELMGNVQIKTFKYLGTKADQLQLSSGAVPASGAGGTVDPSRVPPTLTPPADPQLSKGKRGETG
jgi:Tfp pilus assembly protein PilO